MQDSEQPSPPAITADGLASAACVSTLFSDHAPSYGSDASFLEWHGYLAMEADARQGKNSNFDNHEFYLSATATVSDRLSFLAEMEFEHTPEKLILPIQAFGRLRGRPHAN